MSESKAKSPQQASSGRFAYDGLERAIHEKARLGIMTSLVAHPSGLAFADLKQLCDLTDGKEIAQNLKDAIRPTATSIGT